MINYSMAEIKSEIFIAHLGLELIGVLGRPRPLDWVLSLLDWVLLLLDWVLSLLDWVLSLLD